MTNRDIIIDTNAFGHLLGDRKSRQRIGKIIEKCDNIFVARCSWNNEFKSIYCHQVLTMDRINTSKQLLEEKEKFHKKLPKATPKGELEKKVKKHGANPCDLEICRLAYERAEESRRVAIVTTDKAIHKGIHASSHQLRNIEIEVICPNDYDPEER